MVPVPPFTGPTEPRVKDLDDWVPKDLGVTTKGIIFVVNDRCLGSRSDTDVSQLYPRLCPMVFLRIFRFFQGPLGVEEGIKGQTEDYLG